MAMTPLQFWACPRWGTAVVNQTTAVQCFGPSGVHPPAFGPEGRRAPLALVGTAKNPHLSTAVGVQATLELRSKPTEAQMNPEQKRPFPLCGEP